MDIGWFFEGRNSTLPSRVLIFGWRCALEVISWGWRLSLEVIKEVKERLFCSKNMKYLSDFFSMVLHLKVLLFSWKWDYKVLSLGWKWAQIVLSWAWSHPRGWKEDNWSQKTRILTDFLSKNLNFTSINTHFWWNMGFGSTLMRFGISTTENEDSVYGYENAG